MQTRPKSLDAVHLASRPILNDITVVIPTLGREILQECLAWIAAGSAWPGSLIVVDQSTSQQVARWVEQLNSIGIHGEHVPSALRGRAAGVNCGLERVRTRFVAITDDDCFVDRDWLVNMVDHLVRQPKTVVTGRVEPSGEGVIVVVTSRDPAVYRRPRLKFDALSGGNMGTSMPVFERVGLLDEDPRMRTAEDGEWAYRALRLGFHIVYAPQVVVHHVGWRDAASRTRQYKSYARSHGGFYGKYLRKGDWFIALRAAVHHLRALRHWVRGTVKGERELALFGQAYLTGLLPGILAGLRKDQAR